MKKVASLIILCLVATGDLRAQLAGLPGAFSRMGFGARGMGMGNAMTAVTTREVSSYYNPALPAFSVQRTGSASHGILSLDRRLNFISFVQPIRPTAGLSAGLIYAGVRDIDGRDRNGEHTTNYSVSEYQFWFSFSNRFIDRLSIGVSAKLYYNNLFKDATATTIGLDVGAVYRLSESATIAIAIQEINAKYRWDTSTLYGRRGNVTLEPFPILRRAGIAYLLPHGRGIITLDLENSDFGTTILRGGAEIVATEFLLLRGGIDRVRFGKNPDGVKPSIGFTVEKSIDGLSPSLSYVYVLEPVSSGGFSVVSLTVRF